MPATLLLADDSITIQRVIELTFANEDVRVIAVSDGQAAVKQIDAERPDIVLADVGMPKLDGYAVATHIKQSPALKHIPVLLLTGAFEPVDEEKARATGCDGILVKPVEPQLLIGRVKELLAGRRSPALWPAVLPRVDTPAAPRAAVPPAAVPAAPLTAAPAGPVAGPFDIELDDHLKGTLDELDPDVKPPGFEEAHDDLTRELELLRGTMADTPARKGEGFGDWDIPQITPRRDETLELDTEPLDLGEPVALGADSIAPAAPPSPVHGKPPVDPKPPVASKRPVESAPSVESKPPGVPPPLVRPPVVAPAKPTSAMPVRPPVAAAPRISLATAFSALLAAEESPPEPQPPGAAMVSEQAIEAAVQRVLSRMTEDTVRRLVLETAERLIREEIDKIRSSPR